MGELLDRFVRGVAALYQAAQRQPQVQFQAEMDVPPTAFVYFPLPDKRHIMIMIKQYECQKRNGEARGGINYVQDVAYYVCLYMTSQIGLMASFVYTTSSSKFKRPLTSPIT